MAHFKRKRPTAKSSAKCGICCGQRRHFGPPERTKKKDKVARRELVVGEA
jgi:hypothetical protein